MPKRVLLGFRHRHSLPRAASSEPIAPPLGAPQENGKPARRAGCGLPGFRRPDLAAPESDPIALHSAPAAVNLLPMNALEQGIVELVETGFQPLKARAEIFDFGDKLRFRVQLPEPHAPIIVDNVDITAARDPRDLHWIISEVREQIADKGVTLHAWESG